VSAPWSVVLHEDILGWVLNNFIELFSNDYGNTAGVISWDFLGLKMWLKVSGFNIINELSNVFNCQIGSGSWGLEFLHISWEDSSEGWEISGGDTHELSKSLLDSI